MKKELYDDILTVSRESELDGVLRVAEVDPDITPDDFVSLLYHYAFIKRKCEEIGK